MCVCAQSSTGDRYFFNPTTGESVWERPTPKRSARRGGGAFACWCARKSLLELLARLRRRLAGDLRCFVVCSGSG